MNSDLEQSLKQLKSELDSSSVVKEYLSLKDVLEKNEELKRMRDEIARLTSENKIEERDALLTIYNSHPIVTNYEQAREEVVNLLNQIKNILSE